MSNVLTVLRVERGEHKESKNGLKYIVLMVALADADGNTIIRKHNLWLPNQNSAKNYLEKKEKEYNDVNIKKYFDDSFNRMAKTLINLGYQSSSLVGIDDMTKYVSVENDGVSATIVERQYEYQGETKTTEEIQWINKAPIVKELTTAEKKSLGNYFVSNGADSILKNEQKKTGKKVVPNLADSIQEPAGDVEVPF